MIKSVINISVQHRIPFFSIQGIKSSIVINVSTGGLKSPYTPYEGSQNPDISGINPPFSFSNTDRKIIKKSTQYQSSKYFPDSSIYLEVMNLM